MKLAIMQPYFLPYIGYWQLLNMVDKFVVYDNIKFTKGGWINRNNIMINNKTYLFSLSLKKDSDFLNINERYLANNFSNNITKILRQIENSYKKAPFFHYAFPVVKSIFENKNTNLFNYIYNSIKKICLYLNIETEIIESSSIDVDHNLKSQEKIISICKKLKAENYINLPGGINLYERERFNKEGLKLNFIKPELNEYQQYNNKFTSNLSIIDVIMFNSVGDVKNRLNKFKIVCN